MSGAVAACAGIAGLRFPTSQINVVDTVSDPADASASLTLNTTGDGDSTGNGSSSDPDWAVPNIVSGASYWCRLTVDSGTAPTSGSAVGSWLQLNSARSWTWARTFVGFIAASCTLQIASDAAGTNILSSRTVAAHAEVI